MINEEILSKLDTLEKLQQDLDRKTKDAEAYRDINGKICSILNKMIIAMVIMVLISGLVCGYCVNRMYAFESSMDTECVMSTEEMDSGEGGVLINGDGNNSQIDSDTDISK